MSDPPATDSRSFYVGWLLDSADRETLLARFPPRYEIVVAHHVTQTFGDRTATEPAETRGEVIGLADDSLGVQALVVAICGSPGRPDGATYHITWSLAAGREARESNPVIAERGWTPLANPVVVRLHPMTFGD
jgi:hypothetical protein